MIPAFSSCQFIGYIIQICAHQTLEGNNPRFAVDGRAIRGLWHSCQQMRLTKLFQHGRQARYHDVSDMVGIKHRVQYQI